MAVFPHAAEITVNGTLFSIDEIIQYPFMFHADSYINKNTGERDSFPDGPYMASTWVPIISREMTLFAANGGDVGGIAYYDEDFHFISGEDGYASWSGNQEYSLHIPSRARYLRFTQMKGIGAVTAYLIGTGTVEHGSGDWGWYPGGIIWGWDGAYAVTGTGDIMENVAGAKYSDILFPKAVENLLSDYWAIDPAGYFYKTLYDISRKCVGTQRARDGGYYDATGTAISTAPDYYSFALSVANPYASNCERTCYLDKGSVTTTNIKVRSIAELENALLEAAHCANKCHIYNITIAEGTYDLWAGLDKSRIKPWAEYHAGDHLYMRGLELPGFTNLYGEGKCELQLLLPDDQRTNYELVLSCLNMAGADQASVHNISFVARNCRYCVHDDGGELYADGTVLFENCRFKYLGMTDTSIKDIAYCYGGGFFEGRRAIFRNCVFDGGTDAGAWAGIFVHNHATARKPCYVDVENCVFKHAGHGIYMNMFYNYNENYTLTINNSLFENGADVLLGGAGGGKLYGGGNSEVTITKNASTATEDYLVRR